MSARCISIWTNEAWRNFLVDCCEMINSKNKSIHQKHAYNLPLEQYSKTNKTCMHCKESNHFACWSLFNKRCINLFTIICVAACGVLPSCSTVITTPVTANMKGPQMIFILKWFSVIATLAGKYGRERQMNCHKQSQWDGSPSYWGWYSMNQPDINIVVIEGVTASCCFKNKQHKHDDQKSKRENGVSNHHSWIVVIYFFCIAEQTQCCDKEY